MFRTFLFGLSLALTVSTTMIGPAHAWRRGGDDRREQSAQHATVSSTQAVDIARAKGLVRLHEVKFDDGVWEVEGWTSDGRKIEVDVHPTSGEVLKLEIYARAR